MPLLITLLFFAALFSFEGLWFDARRIRQENQLRRYEQVEHPHRFSEAERYIDLLA